MRVLEEINTHDCWSCEQLIEHQRLALRNLVRHAAERSPYYRDALPAQARGGDVRLQELPTLSKTTLMREWDRIVTDPRLRLDEVERHFEGSAASDLHLAEYRIFETGGSTGQRGIFVYGDSEFENSLAGILRALATVGISASTRLASIGSPSPAHLTNQVFAVFRAGRPASPRLTVTMPVNDLVSALNGYQPEAIISYPTILQLLAEEQAAGSLGIAPRIVVSTSEVLSEETRQRVQDVWGVGVRNAYASTEGGMMATECSERCGLHLWEDTLIFEVVDEYNHPISPGTPGHKVLLTNLWNRVQPLIRYELADAVTLAPGANPTGRPFARIAEVGGRTADILRLPGLAGGTVAVHPMHLRMPFTLPEVRQYQLKPACGQLRVTLVLAPGASLDVIERIRTALIDALKAAGAASQHISIESVESIPRVGSGAKLTLIGSSPCATASST
jgi:phenylacetate-coenzyme A ligase PaaK-like adenylate-forming protein